MTARPTTVHFPTVLMINGYRFVKHYYVDKYVFWGGEPLTDFQIRERVTGLIAEKVIPEFYTGNDYGRFILHD